MILPKFVAEPYNFYVAPAPEKKNYRGPAPAATPILCLIQQINKKICGSGFSKKLIRLQIHKKPDAVRTTTMQHWFYIKNSQIFNCWARTTE
jgi:hypothetical protein